MFTYYSVIHPFQNVSQDITLLEGNHVNSVKLAGTVKDVPSFVNAKTVKGILYFELIQQFRWSRYYVLSDHYSCSVNLYRHGLGSSLKYCKVNEFTLFITLQLTSQIPFLLNVRWLPSIPNPISYILQIIKTEISIKNMLQFCFYYVVFGSTVLKARLLVLVLMFLIQNGFRMIIFNLSQDYGKTYADDR